ncbi:glycoside hydrolase family 97 protein [Massilibacteroides sp.]|uniref:glycoside hydrolase family 97 protein n=1 Tax=Massilibacteroides sp. TaxID=2034766 RepID=UPI00261F17D3|nr:glycoside hydrolase family 97 protein [Massilibacteroides sp.]MDD4516367.1 glycoside hydrolase family 97 catalytic domain-containing protein [Massilibacteroides sp.]
MRILCFCLIFITSGGLLVAQNKTVKSINGRLVLNIDMNNGMPSYSVVYDDKTLVENSPLGFVADIGDFSGSMVFVNAEEGVIDEQYSLTRAKSSSVHYQAKELTYSLKNAEGHPLSIIFRVSNNDVAFRYVIPQNGETACCVIKKEATGFNFPDYATTFITPQATPMIGWQRTKPSYEEGYMPDEALGTPSRYGEGYTFPALFHIGEDGWVLISETGVSSAYCGSHLTEGTKDGLYTIAYPNPGENNGLGSSTPGISLPGETPWRTITVGADLKPIVETTVPFDVVKPLYEPSREYRFGRSTWSWIMWQDNSVNYDDQLKYIDLSAAMGYEYVLIDGLWDKQIGADRIPDLCKYAQSEGVDVFLWYNSNGYWNNAPQGAKQRMHNSIVRKKEMKWLKSIGVKGLKVDFFAGDKQETIKLYEDILSDANDYGLMIIFHGCTLPRGWERMYPNYIASEAVLASENLIFNQKANDDEAYSATLHPFIRNAVGAMEFGPVLLNKRHNRTNDGGSIRRTSTTFQIATAVLFQSAVQMFAIAPNNLEDAPEAAIDFMKEVPTTWDEVQFIDGYPGKYCVLARRHGETWYVAGINATKKTLKLKVNLPMFAGQEIIKYADNKFGETYKETLGIGKDGTLSFMIPENGGIVFTR